MRKNISEATILFAGDSGDGIQLVGEQFTQTVAQSGNDISSFPDFPAEIRAPGGTISGVSGFQLHFGSIDIFAPGDQCDVLVAMNAAAFEKNYDKLKKGGIAILNEAGFDQRNLKSTPLTVNPLEETDLEFKPYVVDITKQTIEILKESGLSRKMQERSKNMFALGFVCWLYGKTTEFVEAYLQHKFDKKPEVLEANLKVLKAGFNYGEITDAFTERFTVEKADMPAGKYRNINGNHALALGFLAAAHQMNRTLFYAGYPITPASDILHFMNQYRNQGVKILQAEDEIAAAGAALGASFGGALGVTASSGPGIALKAETINLAVMLEIPLVIANIQRGGPSTGLPTKTEQSDLLQVLYGRNGESPIPVIAAKKPTDAFWAAYTACKIAVEHMTPVMLLSDGYIANGAEPWRFPKADELPPIKIPVFEDHPDSFEPYVRNADGVRPWHIPGEKGFEHVVGGLEKQDLTGSVSYNPDNHQFMVKKRAEKVENIAKYIPNVVLEEGSENADVLILSWGSTYGSIKTAMKQMLKENKSVAFAHLTYINPFPNNLGELIQSFKKILIPELNNGQLIKLIREKYLVDAVGLNKIKGTPLTKDEVIEAVEKLLK